MKQTRIPRIPALFIHDHSYIMPKVSPYLLLVLTTFFWASNFVVGRAVNPYIPPIALSFWRSLLGLIIILPFALPYMRQQFDIMRRHAVIIIVFKP